MTNKPKPNTCCLFLKNVPKILRERFKAACARRGTDMTKELRKFMEEYAKKDAVLETK
jgi:hypothetical protein